MIRIRNRLQRIVVVFFSVFSRLMQSIRVRRRRREVATPEVWHRVRVERRAIRGATWIRSLQIVFGSLTT